jgi:hypothetical protein
MQPGGSITLQGRESATGHPLHSDRSSALRVQTIGRSIRGGTLRDEVGTLDLQALEAGRNDPRVVRLPYVDLEMSEPTEGAVARRGEARGEEL